MSDESTIRLATEDDIETLDAGMRALGEALGDPFPGTPETLHRAGFGPSPAYRALLAEAADGALVGICMFSPVYSSTMGGAGTYVSDLWVASSVRKRGLGRKLLAKAFEDGQATWSGGFLRLHVDPDNASAIAAYQKLGFVEKEYRLMSLSPEDSANL